MGLRASYWRITMKSYNDIAAAADWGAAAPIATPSVMRVQAVDVVEDPRFIGFIRKACDFPWVPDWREVLEWMRVSVDDPRVGMFVHLENGQFDGLVFVGIGEGVWSYSPTILYAYSDNADSAARHETGAAVYQWLSEAGFNSLMGVSIGDNNIENILTAGEAGGIAQGEVVGKLVRFRIRR